MNSKNNANDRILGFIYIFSMIVAYTTEYGDFRTGYKLGICIGMFWIGIAFVKLCVNRFALKNDFNRELKFFTFAYMMPHIMIHLYTITLMIIGEVSFEYFSTNLTVYVPTLLVMSSVYLLGTKVLFYNGIAIIGSWLLSFVFSLIVKGPLIIPHAIIQAYFNSHYHVKGFKYNYLENNDIVLAIGYFLVLYILSKEKITKKNFLFIVFVLLIMILGMKRIAVLGIFSVILFRLTIKYQSPKIQYYICRFIGIAIFIMSYVFIILIFNWEYFFSLLSDLGINTMGRNFFYKAVIEYADFSPTYLGIGRNVVSFLLNDGELTYLNVGGVHSDIIKMFVENGFIMFALWLYYYLWHMVKEYKKRFSISEVIMYVGTMIYAFTLYLTDNTENYFVCQVLNISIPMVYALKNKYNTNKANDF